MYCSLRTTPRTFIASNDIKWAFRTKFTVQGVVVHIKNNKNNQPQEHYSFYDVTIFTIHLKRQI